MLDEMILNIVLPLSALRCPFSAICIDFSYKSYLIINNQEACI